MNNHTERTYPWKVGHTDLQWWATDTQRCFTCGDEDRLILDIDGQLVCQELGIPCSPEAIATIAQYIRGNSDVPHWARTGYPLTYEQNSPPDNLFIPGPVSCRHISTIHADSLITGFDHTVLVDSNVWTRTGASASATTARRASAGGTAVPDRPNSPWPSCWKPAPPTGSPAPLPAVQDGDSGHHAGPDEIQHPRLSGHRLAAPPTDRRHKEPSCLTMGRQDAVSLAPIFCTVTGLAIPFLFPKHNDLPNPEAKIATIKNDGVITLNILTPLFVNLEQPPPAVTIPVNILSRFLICATRRDTSAAIKHFWGIQAKEARKNRDT